MDALRSKLEEMGEEPPPSPEVDPGLMWVWKAWNRLTDSRSWQSGGMGAPTPGKIAFHSVLEWCEFHDYDGEDVQFLDQMVQAMDGVFIAWYSDKVAEASKKS